MTKYGKHVRLLWGVTIRTGNEPPVVLGVGWYGKIIDERYEGDHRGLLLFKTRQHATAWRNGRLAFYRKHYTEDHICRKWRFTVVRVKQETMVIT